MEIIYDLVGKCQKYVQCKLIYNKTDNNPHKY